MARALLDIADPARIHDGSDWPFTPTEGAIKLSDEIDGAELFDDDLHGRRRGDRG